MGSRRSFWLVVHLLLWCLGYSPGHSQYTSDYLDIYPRLIPHYEKECGLASNITIIEVERVHPVVLGEMELKTHFENRLTAERVMVDRGFHSVQGRHMLHSGIKSHRTVEAERHGDYFERITRTVARKLGLNHGQISECRKYSGPANGFCDARYRYPCPEEKFRRIDGTCNNMENPSWGSAEVCFRRILPAAYHDGISAIRNGHHGDKLPNPRHISLSMHGDEPLDARSYTHFLAQWGQFVTHDISSIKPYLVHGHEILNCCPNYAPGGHHPELHPRCLPIYLSQDDVFYASQNINCINFVRAATCPSCRLGPREHTNQVTSYLDGSGIYASSMEDHDYLRDTYDRAKLAVQQTPFGYLLPRSRHPITDQCSNTRGGHHCFAAGDYRVNQHPALGAIHTTFVRQHNHLVDIFRSLNPHWNVERLFQEVRRVIIAQLQFITYREYIHIVLGPTMMTYYDLWPLKHGHTKYASVLDASLMTAFSAAAYRYGHSLVHNDWWLVNRTSGEVMTSYHLRDVYFSTDSFYSSSYDENILGMMTQHAKKFDRHVSEDLTHYVYRVRGTNHGYDLAAINLYRNRDVGLQGYIHYLDFCYGVTIRTFEDLHPFMEKENVRRLKSVYRHVSDIDLWTGGLMERILRDGVVGPTFGCLIGLQYYYMKFGDRFFVEHGGLVNSFTDHQLHEIRKVWMSRLLCDNGDYITWSTLDVFQPPSESNPIMPCSQIPRMDYSAWKEHPHPHD